MRAEVNYVQTGFCGALKFLVPRRRAVPKTTKTSPMSHQVAWLE